MPVEIGNGQAPPQQEDVVFLPSGKIQVMVSEGDVRILRRPKFGEFRRFREVLYEEQDRAHEVLLEKADQLVAEIQSGEEKSPEAQRKELIDIVETARRVREDTTRQEEQYIKWCRDVVTTLSGKPLEVEDDDLPFLFSDGTFVTAVQRHWRSVPLPSGVR